MTLRGWDPSLHRRSSANDFRCACDGACCDYLPKQAGLLANRTRRIPLRRIDSPAFLLSQRRGWRSQRLALDDRNRHYFSMRIPHRTATSMNVTEYRGGTLAGV
jgi:hypothetical protein